MNVKKGSGNVFADLGFNEEESANLIIRAELMARTRDIIKKHRWTQIQAGEKLGAGQSRISDLMSGRIDKFTVDALINYLATTGMEVKCKVRKRRKTAV